MFLLFLSGGIFRFQPGVTDDFLKLMKGKAFNMVQGDEKN